MVSTIIICVTCIICVYIASHASVCIAHKDVTYKPQEGEGITQEQLSAVFCPIGLSIGAETPAEIAISIVGEMILETKKASVNSAHINSKLPAKGTARGVALGISEADR